MEEMYADVSFVYTGVIIVLSVLVVALGIALALVLHRKKKPVQHYCESAFCRVEDESLDQGQKGKGVIQAVSVEKAKPVHPYTNWDKEEILEEKSEASFGGFVEDTPSEDKAPEVSAQEPVQETQAGDALVSEKENRAGLDQKQALLLFKSYELLLTLSDGLKKLVLAKTDDARKEKLTEMQEALKLLDAKGEWGLYRSCFEQLYPGFWVKIQSVSSEEMSPYELRLCALLSLGMGTKELAELTNRSVRTVETSIYKIRKKLGMGSEEKTFDFLRRFVD